MVHSTRFGRGTSLGMKMCASIPAAAAYAASALAALPAEGMATFFKPYALHIVTAADRPRALKEPVGFSPSSLMYTLALRRLRIIGVLPSPSDTGSTSGNNLAKRHMPPWAGKSRGLSLALYGCKF